MNAPTSQSGSADRPDDLSPIKRALVEIRQLRDTVARLEASASEPIAVIGVGCRLPGGIDGPDRLWSVLRDGIDTVVEVPSERWDADQFYDPDPDAVGRMWTRFGGFIDGVDGFDAGFFGISPLEATSIDPQQRLVLEVAWEALEHAGIAADRLNGTPTGVFMGVGNTDYARRLFHQSNLINAYAGSGGSPSAVSGRLSYQLGLRGPSMAVDTACSASLVSVHLACQSLRNGESDLALAGGVNLMLGPEAHITFTKARMMAPDGRCKSFDDAADGYGRGEGAGVVVLKRLSDARANGDHVMAVIAGSAVNQDGRSAGLSAPNGPAQVEVIKAALADAGLEPGDIDYVEAHGTGTPLGDPIELQAIGEALGGDRASDAPLIVGSCKTNFGHLEAAAGITGLLKLIVSIGNRAIPPNLHFDTPNTLLDWGAVALHVPTSLTPWPQRDAPMRAGVSSFGFTGTNAHVIVEDATAHQVTGANAAPGGSDRSVDAYTSDVVERPRHILALSAADDAALRDIVQRYLERLDDDPAVDLAQLCWSANTGRAPFARRLAITCADVAELRSGLESFLDGTLAHHVLSGGTGASGAPSIGFAFTGQGAAYRGAGRDLSASSPAFRQALDDCVAAFDPLLDRPLLELLQPSTDTDATEPSPTNEAQPALFALEYAMAAMWRSWGVEPMLVLGHSLGEVAAACVAGIFDLADAARLIASRSSLMQQTAAGAMAAATLTDAQLDEIVRDHGVEVAGYNGPGDVVLSGQIQDIEAACDAVDELGQRHRRLAVDRAFHSRLMDPVIADFERSIADLRFAPPAIQMISNVTGELATDDISSAEYWSTHIRQPVRFELSMRCAVAQGVTHLVEIGPAPLLLGMASRYIDLPVDDLLPTLHPSEPEWTAVLGTVQALWVAGVDIDWNAFDAGHTRRRVKLPTYPFQRRPYWFELPEQRGFVDDPAHTWRSLTAALDRSSETGPVDVDLRDYDAKWASLEQLTIASASDVLAGAGIFAAAGERSTIDAVRERLGAPEHYDHLLRRWLDRLVGTGDLDADGDEYVAPAPLSGGRAPARLADAEQQLAGDPYLMAYIRQCSRLLPAVISGQESPLTTLFPDGSLELAEGIYQRSVSARYINQLAASAAHALTTALPFGRPIRILEIGAGTGGTSAAVFEMLPADRTHYWFTDVSDLFLDQARSTFTRYPFIQFATFDLEGDAVAQGYELQSFDLVLAANAIHATRDLRRSLETVHSLLAPGGVLMLVESTEHLAWFDMTTGLIEGWQVFDDDLRVDNPLLPVPTWLGALSDAGFANVAAWPRPGSIAEQLGQHLLVAQTQGDASFVRARQGDIDQDAAFDQATGAFDTSEAAIWHERLADVPAGERVDVLRDLAREQVMQILHLEADRSPGSHDGLVDLGFDSLMAVRLSGRLTQLLALDEALPSTLVFDHPTIAAAATFLLARLDEQDNRGEHDSGDGSGAGADGETLQFPSRSADSDEDDQQRATRVAAMSDEEIAARLLDRLDSQ